MGISKGNRKVVIFAPHLDDETLGAGGTLLRHKEKGDSVFWVIFTIALRNSPTSYVNKRRKIALAVARAYGFEDVIILNYYAGELDKVGFKELIDKITEVLQRIKPDVVYTVGASDVHTDHDVVYRSVMAACKPSVGYVKCILAYEIPSSTNWAFSEKSKWFEPQVYVDISKYLPRKIEILRMYEDQICDPPHARSVDAVKALALYRGSSVGLKYAEAFKLLRYVR